MRSQWWISRNAACNLFVGRLLRVSAQGRRARKADFSEDVVKLACSFVIACSGRPASIVVVIASSSTTDWFFRNVLKAFVEQFSSVISFIDNAKSASVDRKKDREYS